MKFKQIIKLLKRLAQILGILASLGSIITFVVRLIEWFT